jgi:hypothetical protein
MPAQPLQENDFLGLCQDAVSYPLGAGTAPDCRSSSRSKSRFAVSQSRFLTMMIFYMYFNLIHF